MPRGKPLGPTHDIPRRDARILELSRVGHSSRTVAALLAKEGLEVSHATVANVVKRAAAPAPPRSPAAPPVSERPRDEEALAGEDAPAALDAGAVADLDLRQLADLAKAFDDSVRSALAVKDTRALGALLKSRKEIAREIARLRPVVPPDPDKDPANVEARNRLRLRLERLVASGMESDAGLALLRAHVARAEEAAAARAPVAEAAE